jgi:O-antigen ligase
MLLKKENWLLFLYALTMISLVIEARFFLSQAMIWLLASAIFSFAPTRFPFFNISETFKKSIKLVWTYRAFAMIMLFFLIVFVSGFWSTSLSYWSEKSRIRLPFIVIPLAFAWLPAVPKRHYQSIFYGMLLLMSIVVSFVLINYIIDYERITATLLHGKNIPVPMNHIRFSLLLAFTIIAGTILYYEKFVWKYAWERKFILVLTAFLFIGIHILSVRSGITALYLTALFLGFRYYIVKEKEYKKGFSAIFMLMAFPIVAYLTMPSLQNKVEYARRDFNAFVEGKGSDFSDSERLGSILVGLDIGNRNPIIGCGYGDLWYEIQTTYARVFPLEKEYKLPHNQLVMTYAGLGIIGVIIFIFAFLYPIFYRKNYRDWYFLALHIIVFFSFLVEATLETQVGTALYTFFLGLGLNYNKGSN